MYGDFNARTSNHGVGHSIISDRTHDSPVNSQDSQDGTVNYFGSELSAVCADFDFCILKENMSGI